MPDFVERRIQQAQRAGAFDDLALRGRPIPDLGSERPEGWWAASFVERDKRLRELWELREQACVERSRALAGRRHDDVLAELLRLRERIATANAEMDEKDRIEWFDVEADLAAWRRRERHRRWGVTLDRDR